MSLITERAQVTSWGELVLFLERLRLGAELPPVAVSEKL